jgi:branched-chain amino acid transport system ATP-binding protein
VNAPEPKATPTGTGPEQHALELDRLSVTYRNGATAVSGVSLTVLPGTIAVVVGRNGAGKTSLLRGIAGFLRSEGVRVGGSVRLGATSLAGSTPAAAHAAGAVMVPERHKVFPTLTVAEHLKIAKRDRSRFDDGTFPVLAKHWNSKASHLSGGERQMLALALAFAHEPRALLVDELSLGLAPVIRDRLLAVIRDHVDTTGMLALLVEQDVTSALGIADAMYVLDHGELVWQGAPTDSSIRDLQAAILGGAE